MTKFITTMFALTSLTTLAIGQNLVPNSSFENYTACPTFYDQLSNATSWYNPALLTPDYFNTCGTIIYCQIPLNHYGHQYARTGDAYAGIYASQFSTDTNIREYIRTELIEPLMSGVLYCVSFYVNLSDSSKQGISSFGVYFSNTNSSPMNGYIMNVTPQIINLVSNPLSDKSNWMLVSGVYTASGGEKYLTIGNFNNDLNSGLHTLPGSYYYQYSYYYIDDISVTTDTLGCRQTGIHERELSANFKLYPNPTSQFATLEFNNSTKQNCTLTLYNSLGQQARQVNNINGQTITLHRDNLPSGLYYLQLTQDNQTIATDKLVITD